MAMRRTLIALVEAVRVDQRKSDGKRRRAFVMVDDDHVEPGRLRFVQRLESLRAAIDGDDQARAPRPSRTSASPDGP